MHLYGSVGDYKFENGSMKRPYLTDIAPHELSAAASSLNIISEVRDSSKDFEKAREWFDWARHVYILGFGFDRLNCKRLGFYSVIDVNNKNQIRIPYVHASVYGLTPHEVSLAKHRLLGGNCSWDPFDHKNLMTLRHAGLPQT